MPIKPETQKSHKLRRILTVASCLMVGTLAAPTAGLAASSTALPTKEACAYTAHSISILQQFSQMVGRQVNCAMVFANAATTWSQWENPWFINYYNPDSDWSQWATAPNTTRQLVITLNLFPSDLNGADWLDQGAAGDYEQYAAVLASNLVAAGLGNSIIRLAPEMNGNWYSYSLGSTQADWAKWDEFWTDTVDAMRSVTGANFKFDWCISDLYRALPLSEIYPGNNVVDIIGDDVYDTGNLGSTATARWNEVYNGSGGIANLLAFARSQGKPISIPEWGVDPVADGGFGDDPTFVNGIASVVANNPTVYQSYFYKYGQVTQLAAGTQSLAAYQAHFGANGDSVDTGSDSWTTTSSSSGSSASPTTSSSSSNTSASPTASKPQATKTPPSGTSSPAKATRTTRPHRSAKSSSKRHTKSASKRHKRTRQRRHHRRRKR